MSFVGNTIFIIMFLLMPGFFFWHFFYFGLANRTQAWVASENVVRSLIRYLCASIPINFTMYYIIKILGYSFDFYKALCIFTGCFEPKSLALVEIGKNINEYFCEIFIYWLAAILFGVILGIILNKIAVKTQLYFKGYFKLKNYWFYRFFNTDSPAPKDIFQQNFLKPPPPTYSSIHLLTKGDGDKTILYQGNLYDYTINKDGALESIVLVNPSRDYGRHMDREWHQLHEDYIVLNANNIINMTIQGIYVILYEPFIRIVRLSNKAERVIKFRNRLFNRIDTKDIKLSFKGESISDKKYSVSIGEQSFKIIFKKEQDLYRNAKIQVTFYKKKPLPPKVL